MRLEWCQWLTCSLYTVYFGLGIEHPSILGYNREAILSIIVQLFILLSIPVLSSNFTQYYMSLNFLRFCCVFHDKPNNDWSARRAGSFIFIITVSVQYFLLGVDVHAGLLTASGRTPRNAR